MITTLVAVGLFAPPVLHLEAKLASPTFSRGSRIRIEIFAVNDSDREVVIGKAAIGNCGSGSMEGKVSFVGSTQPELNHYNPSLGQIMMGDKIVVGEGGFAKIPPKGRALVFFEQIDGEWKDGYTPRNAPRGIQALSIPTRAGEYKFTYTYSFSRKSAEESIQRWAYREGYKLDEHVIPEKRYEVVFPGDAKSLFASAVEGKWTVSGSFKVL